jgi:hypothetical protein
MSNEAGQGCAVRNFYLPRYTIISKRQPTVDGICTRLAFHADRAESSKLVAFAFFEQVDTNIFSPVAGTRVTKTVSPVAAECIELVSPSDFTGFEVLTSYYLGCYYAGYQDYNNNGGIDVWITAGDQTENSNVTYALDTEGIDALTADIKFPTVTLGTTPTATLGTTPTATLGG